MGSNLPAWWSSAFPDLVAKRESMPGVERLQTVYVKYRRFQEAQVGGGPGWDLNTSRKNFEQVARLEQQFFMQDDHPLFNPLAPDNITMRITEAPAEFAVPVKQDRRLSPSFKVRVDVRYRNRVGIPITVKAHLITQQDKDNVLAWLPEDLNPYGSSDDKSQRSMTELKGTTCITHHFEGCQGGPASNAPAPIMNTGMGNLASMPRLNITGLPNMASVTLTSGQRLVDTSPAALAAMKLKGFIGWPQAGGQPGLDGTDQSKLVEQLLLQQQQQQQLGHSELLAANGLGGGMDPGLMHHAQLGANGGGFGAASGVHQLMQQLNQNQLGNMLLLNNGGGQPGLSLMQHDDRSAQVAVLHAQQEAQLAASIATGMVAAAQQQHHHHQQQQQQQACESHVLSHEYEFTNLELLKPTRMNKVYIVFSCTILDMDILYAVYNVPTIGICRAEQREKACQKLGVPLSVLAMEGSMGVAPSSRPDAVDMARMGMGTASINMHPVQAAAAGAVQVHHRKRGGMMGADSDDSEGYQHISAPAIRNTAADVDMSGVSNGQGAMSGALSRASLQDWIMEEYEGTGLTRKLTRLDLQALLSQAGFPTEGGPAADHATVSQVQWDEFCGQFRSLLCLLRQIAGVWNLEDPCVVCGFDMDRQGTVTALATEPAGTFLCRFSMSQPGCLVLSCKTVQGHPKAEADDLIHAIINISDLHERRVDTWIRDFAGATHVLDVYRHKRVDKRKVFTSNYTRLKGLDAQPPFTEADSESRAAKEG